MLAFALSSVAIGKRTTSLTISNVIALKKRSNIDKKKSKEESHVFMCVQCKYSHLVGEMFKAANGLSFNFNIMYRESSDDAEYVF